MIESYFARLVWLSLAVFFLVNLASGLAVSAATPGIVRLMERLRPRLAARILLIVRLFPLALGFFAVAAACVPSYLRLEPDEAGEEVGVVGGIAAGLAIAILAAGLCRGVRNVARSSRWLDDVARS